MKRWSKAMLEEESTRKLGRTGRKNSIESVGCAWSPEHKPDLVCEKHGAEAENMGMQVMGW